MKSDQEILETLKANKTSIRRKAVKKIAKEKLVHLGDALYDAFLEEIKDERTAETQEEMVIAFGILNYKKAKQELKKICNRNYLFNLLTTEAAQAYVRVSRKDLKDVKPVFELIEFGNYAVTSGALGAIARDRMMPSNKEIKRLFEFAKDLNLKEGYYGWERGVSDPRINLVIAASQWDLDLCKDFILHCKNTAVWKDKVNKDFNLIKACENSLLGKHSLKLIYY